MAGINLSLNYFDNPKTLRLVARLGPGADVLPIKLWCYVGKHHPESGALAMLVTELEHACGWWGEKGLLATEMVSLGFLIKKGEEFVVNDWHEHSGHLAIFKKRAVKAARKRWMLGSSTSNATSIAKTKTSNAASNALSLLSLPTKLTTHPLTPFADLLSAYNSHRGLLPAAQTLTSKRKKNMTARWREKPSLEYWVGVVKRLAESKFACEGSWANIDWVFQNDNNHVKVTEGKYDDKNRNERKDQIVV